jgi:3-phytase
MLRGLCLGLVLMQIGAAATRPVSRPEARGETDPVPHKGDAADDPAVWVHPSRPERSLILGTDKLGGLIVYGMDGKQKQVVSPKCMPDNVDLIHGVALDGRATDLALASVREPGKWGVKLWAIDEQTLKLSDATDRVRGAKGVIRVFQGDVPYGLCTYQSRKTGRSYFFVNDKRGRIEQYELKPDGVGLAAERVRSLKVGSMVEGCVADDELGHLYVAEETVGVWRFAAEPNAGDARKSVVRIGEHGVVADVEGLAIYHAAGGRGYLIVSSQGNNTFKVFERGGENAFVMSIDPTASARIDDVSDTDGIAVTNRPTSLEFAKGVLLVQDGVNRKGRNQNFKLYAWEDVAGGRLLVDPDHMSISGR